MKVRGSKINDRRRGIRNAASVAPLRYVVNFESTPAKMRRSDISPLCSWDWNGIAFSVHGLAVRSPLLSCRLVAQVVRWGSFRAGEKTENNLRHYEKMAREDGGDQR